MDRENEEQKPTPQTLGGALQKDANCKCLVLTLLIYGCLAAIVWCRCTNVTKVAISFAKYPFRSTKQVSPCEDGYVYIPIAFMGMLYLVYLVECYHSSTRIELKHARSQHSVFEKLTDLKLAQPTVWWKAISYHYVRRQRHITRYRNGDNYTTTQVYYDRINSHTATSFYFYGHCGWKDITKSLVPYQKIPITKIMLSKSFAFSNVRSATEFEEARSRFFAEQEFRDDYMEMREGLDLGYNFSPTSLVAVLGNPWFAKSYVYWCLSALLLSWPLRIIIECNTQHVDYQITKLFGVNYDTPSRVQIHTSASQLSAPGAYMLVPSYSEALLMEPAGIPTRGCSDFHNDAITAEMESDHLYSDMVPSYSEALLLEPQSNNQLSNLRSSRSHYSFACLCPGQTTKPQNSSIELREQNSSSQRRMNRRSLQSPCAVVDSICYNCLRGQKSTFANPKNRTRNELRPSPGRSISQTDLSSFTKICKKRSEPDLRSILQPLKGPRLENNVRDHPGPIPQLKAVSEHSENLPIPSRNDNRIKGQGAIPKTILRSRVTVNPMWEHTEKIPSPNTYFCLKSILKNNRRRYTMITLDELDGLTRNDKLDFCRNADVSLPGVSRKCQCDSCRSDFQKRRPKSLMLTRPSEKERGHVDSCRENSRL